ncbi:UNVERIFIED_CONTAM: hypothetical protein GTU68_030072 [Idotea baltica]|nr:hypothetical protein [Idotea baltica]
MVSSIGMITMKTYLFTNHQLLKTILIKCRGLWVKVKV